MRAICRMALIAALIFLTSFAAQAASYIGTHTGNAFSGSTITATSFSYGAGHSVRVIIQASPTTMTLTSVTCGGVTATLGATVAGTQKFVAVAILANMPGTACTLTANLVGTCTNCAMMGEEWSGDATTSPLDQSAVAEVLLGSSAGLAISPPSVTTTVNGDDLWCPVAQGNAVTPTAASGWGSFHTAANPWWSVDQTQASSGATSGLYPCFTSGANSFDNEIGIIAVKPGGGPASPNPARSLFIHPGPF